MKISVSSWLLALAELPALGEHSCFSEQCFPLFTGPFLDIRMQNTEVNARPKMEAVASEC